MWRAAVSLVDDDKGIEALAILTVLAEAGYSLPNYVIANLFERGCGDLEPDLLKAEVWYARAVEQDDNEDARFDYARIVFRRSREDMSSDAACSRANFAVKEMEQLAAKENVYAMLFLGLLYSQDDFFPADLGKAEHYLQLAAEKGYVIAKLHLSGVLWKQRKRWSAVSLRVSALMSGLLIALKNSSDPRLALLLVTFPRRGDGNAPYYARL